MIYYLQTFNLVFALGGLTLFGLTLVLLYDYCFKSSKLYERLVHPHVLLISTFVLWGGVATSLLYSEYFGFVPCSLCWLQRVALYSQALVSLVALKSKEVIYFPLYGIVLSAFGLCVAIYQYIYQLIPSDIILSSGLPCLADGSSDCGAKVIDVFGFVTFPLLSAITFFFLIVIYLHTRRQLIVKI